MTYKVKDVDLDLYKYYEHTFLFRYIDYHVTNEYVDSNTMIIHVQLLNQNLKGTTESIQLLLSHRVHQDSQIISIEPFSGNHYKMEFKVEYLIEPDFYNPMILLDPHPKDWWNYKFPIQKITRKKFNKLFETDVVILPKTLFAIGIADSGQIRRDVEGRRPEGEAIPSGRSPDEDNEVGRHSVGIENA